MTLREEALSIIEEALEDLDDAEHTLNQGDKDDSSDGDVYRAIAAAKAALNGLFP